MNHHCHHGTAHTPTLPPCMHKSLFPCINCTLLLLAAVLGFPAKPRPTRRGRPWYCYRLRCWSYSCSTFRKWTCEFSTFGGILICLGVFFLVFGLQLLLTPLLSFLLVHLDNRQRRRCLGSEPNRVDRGGRVEAEQKEMLLSHWS